MFQRNKSFILIFTFYCNWKAHKYQPTQTEFALAAVRNKRLSVLDLQNVRTVSSTSTTVWVLDCRLYCHVPKYTAGSQGLLGVKIRKETKHTENHGAVENYSRK